MSEDLKSFVLQHMEVVRYHGNDVLVLYNIGTGGESLFGAEKWIRNGNSTVKVKDGLKSIQSF